MVYYNIVCWFIYIGVQKTHEFRIRNFSHSPIAGSPGDNPTATCGMYSSGDAEATRGKVQLVACLVSWSKDGQEPKMGISPQNVGEWGL